MWDALRLDVRQAFRSLPAAEQMCTVVHDLAVAQPFDPVPLRTTGPPMTIIERESLDSAPAVPSGFSVSNSRVLAFQASDEFAPRLSWFDAAGECGASRRRGRKTTISSHLAPASAI